ncbi:hypothetical protein O6H91_04G096900 [Diphasiastrum complanatum]|uniref:Uncharacterized protein n=1 Tax=Diphasiastrum complanatum TaxID=34168 RepID=A0ACC2DZC3_DIPCM|nr:hypothetical protein O6H91_04G096900 [Diphasiastrum complanatum]
MGSPSGHNLAANPDYQTKVAMGKNAEMDRRSTLSIRESMPTYVKELIAGGVAGGIAKTSVAPLERVKILFQTRYGNFQSLGVWRSLLCVSKTEGVGGLYRGNGASVLRVVPYAALHFMTYEQYRRWLIEKHPFLATGPLVDLMAGSLAGGTAVLFTYPLDLARTKLAYQVANHSFSYTNQASGSISSCSYQPYYRGIRDVLTTVYKDGGLRGLYRGVAPTLYGIIPYAGLKFYVYESLKGSLPSEQQQSVSVKLACGAVAGLVGQTFTYPLDVVRRQMQVQRPYAENGFSGLGSAEFQHRGTMDGIMSVIRTQGWRQMFAGLSINYLKLAPSVAIGFAAYDGMKSWLGVPPRERAKKSSSR